jgi:hypothetical protein
MFYNISIMKCQHCSLQGCLLCDNLTACRLCDTNNLYLMNNSTYQC